MQHVNREKGKGQGLVWIHTTAKLMFQTQADGKETVSRWKKRGYFQPVIVKKQQGCIFSHWKDTQVPLGEGMAIILEIVS